MRCKSVTIQKSKNLNKKIAALRAELDDALIEIREKDETILANISLNQSICIDKEKLELFKNKYEKTLQEFNMAKLESKSRSEDHLRSTVKIQKEFKVIQDKEQKNNHSFSCVD